MTDDADQPDKPPILHRPIPNRVMEWVLIVLALAVFIIIVIPMCATRGPRYPGLQDLSNLRQLLVTIHAYAADHDDNLPTNMLVIRDYLGTDDRVTFQSLLDHEASLVFDDTPDPGWYQYGSYWFLYADGLTLAVEQPAEIIFAYRTPRLDHERYIVGHLDGSVGVLTIEEFEQRMNQQEELLSATSSARP